MTRPIMDHDLIDLKVIFEKGLGITERNAVKVRQRSSNPDLMVVSTTDRTYEVRRTR